MTYRGTSTWPPQHPEVEAWLATRPDTRPDDPNEIPPVWATNDDTPDLEPGECIDCGADITNIPDTDYCPTHQPCCDICDQPYNENDPDVRRNDQGVYQCGPCSRTFDQEYGYHR